MASKPLRHQSKQRSEPLAIVLEPGMSVKQYTALKTKWNKILAKSFTDIEYVSETGETSPFFRGYSSQALANRVDEATLDYYCLARTFLYRADWVAVAPYRQHKLYKFLWDLHSEGVEFAKIVELLKKRVERSFGYTRKPTYGTSIWFVHTTIKRIEKEFLELLRTNPAFFE